MVRFDGVKVSKARAAFSASESDFWINTRDGRPASLSTRPTFGFRVTKYFKSTSPLGSEFLPGMQGKVLQRGDEGGVYVHVKDLFDAKGEHLKDWIHEDFIEIGTKLYGSWSVDVCSIPRAPSKFTQKEHALFNDPKYKHLALGISTFLRKLAITNPDCLMAADFARLGGSSGNKVPYITAQVLDGVDKAGLLGVLNNPRFTMDELESNAKSNCKSPKAQNEAGIYFRRYIGSKPTPGQSKKPLSLYVGQTVDFYNRCIGWAATGHEEVKEESESVEMRALCRLELVFYKEHRYIVEQLFTSLLQTYKQALLGRTVGPGDDQATFHVKNCSDMNKIASAAANESKWTGAVQRKGFWNDSYSSCAGLNWQSPISEAPLHEPKIWLESRGYIPDPENPGKSIPVSNFTREVPKRMTVLKPGKKSASQSDWFIAFAIMSQEKKEYALRITQVLPDDFSSDSEDWPIDGSSYHITIEVRTDWKPHPFSWARLPLIGPFKDWDRANSWAINIRWVSPSGQNRVKYFHCLRPYMLMNDNSNGSIQPYARGIEVIHWLYNEKIPADQQHRWIQTPPFAQTKLIEYDFIRQMVTFKAGKPITTTAPVSSDRKTPAAIKAEMEGRGPHGDFGIRNVGVTLAQAKKATPGKWGTRRKCDCCMFYARSAGPGPCTIEDGSIVCGNCLKIFGRPFCSYTLGVPPVKTNAPDPGNSFEELASRGDTANALLRSALHGIRGSTGDAMATTDPLMVEVNQGDEDALEAVESDEEDEFW